MKKQMNEKEWFSGKIDKKLKNRLREYAEIQDVSLNKVMKWAFENFLREKGEYKNE